MSKEGSLSSPIVCPLLYQGGCNRGMVAREIWNLIHMQTSSSLHDRVLKNVKERFISTFKSSPLWPKTSCALPFRGSYHYPVATSCGPRLTWTSRGHSRPQNIASSTALHVSQPKRIEIRSQDFSYQGLYFSLSEVRQLLLNKRAVGYTVATIVLKEQRP